MAIWLRTCRILVAAFAFTLMVACSAHSPAGDSNSGSTAPSSKEQMNGTRVVIGMSLATLQEERWLKDRDSFIAAAEELGAEVNVQAANSDQQRQITQVENMISQGVDVLVIVPHDAEAAAVIVEKAHAAGIKVISYDRLIKNATVDIYVSFDNERIGEMQAEAITSLVPTGTYVYIGGAVTDNNSHLLKKGAFAILEPFIERGDIQIVYDAFTKDWVPSNAAANMKNALASSGNRIDAVIAANDGTAGGVIQALTETDLLGKVPISGQDAELAALQRIVQGTQTMTVYKPIQLLAKQAAELAVRAARDQPIVMENTIFNGKIEVPAILLKPIAVDKTNLTETVIRDGFHSREEVFGK